MPLAVGLILARIPYILYAILLLLTHNPILASDEIPPNLVTPAPESQPVTPPLTLLLEFSPQG